MVILKNTGMVGQRGVMSFLFKDEIKGIKNCEANPISFADRADVVARYFLPSKTGGQG